MPYTLTEAAAATGMVRSTIFKACKSGKISFSLDENDHMLIEPAELHRVYPPKSKETVENVDEETDRTIGNSNGNNGLLQELAVLREKLSGLERLHERERSILSAQVEDLRRDREDLRGERDKLLKVLDEQAGTVRLLSGPKPDAAAPVPMPRRWFARFRRA